MTCKHNLSRKDVYVMGELGKFTQKRKLLPNFTLTQILMKIRSLQPISGASQENSV